MTDLTQLPQWYGNIIIFNLAQANIKIKIFMDNPLRNLLAGPPAVDHASLKPLFLLLLPYQRKALLHRHGEVGFTEDRWLDEILERVEIYHGA